MTFPVATVHDFEDFADALGAAIYAEASVGRDDAVVKARAHLRRWVDGGLVEVEKTGGAS